MCDLLISSHACQKGRGKASSYQAAGSVLDVNSCRIRSTRTQEGHEE